MDKLQWEKNQLEAENARLRGSKSEEADVCKTLKQSEKRISDLETELNESQMQLVELWGTDEMLKQERSQAKKKK